MDDRINSFIWDLEKELKNVDLHGVDPFDGAHVPPFRVGKKAPLRVNPEQSFDFAQDRPEQAKRVEGQAPPFIAGCVEWVNLS